jgi:hypothetical protein
MSEEKVITPPAILRLPGHESAPARAEAVFRPRSVRLTHALLSLALYWGLTPVVALIPPHLPWALTAFGLGIYFAWANWRGEYKIRRFEGACPRCGNELEIEEGSKISLPHRMTCYNCHHEPVLYMDSPRG